MRNRNKIPDKWFNVEGVIIGFLVPDSGDPKYDLMSCLGETLVVRDLDGRCFCRSIINDVFMAEDGEQADPELNFKIGDRVTFTTSWAEQFSYGYIHGE